MEKIEQKCTKMKKKNILQLNQQFGFYLQKYWNFEKIVKTKINHDSKIEINLAYKNYKVTIIIKIFNIFRI